MYRLRYLKSAVVNLDNIYRYIRREGGNPESARRFVDALRHKCRTLAGLPGHMGRPRPELMPEIRSFAFGNHVIFFRYVEDSVLEIINILEGHQDIDDHFREAD